MIVSACVLAQSAGATFLGASGRIAFVRPTRDGDFHIFVITPSGRALRQLTNAGTSDFTPAWSPDGSLIVFTRRSGSGGLDVFEIRANGSRLAQITDGPPGMDNTDPSWSPDGQSVAFTRGPSSGSGPTQIYTMRIGPARAKQLTNDTSGTSAPTWTAGLIAYVQGQPPHSSIWTMRPDGSHKRRLTGLNSGGDDPDFSPTGSMITFDRRSAHGGSSIYLMDLDGRHMHRITRAGAFDFDPVFSPDATRIAFAERSKGRVALYTITPQGKQLHHLTGGVMPSSEPSWQPTLIAPL